MTDNKVRVWFIGLGIMDAPVGPADLNWGEQLGEQW